MARKSVEIHIGGQRYLVRGDADPTYLRQLAAFLDERMQEVRASSKVVLTEKLAVLAALNVADELFRARRRHAALRREIGGRLDRLTAYLDQQEKKLSRAIQTE